MKKRELTIGTIPATIYGAGSGRAYLYVHGRRGSKADAEGFASIATARGYDVVAADLPGHGGRTADPTPCDARHGSEELLSVYGRAAGLYPELSLFACSLGAYFSLLAFRDLSFRRCLFLSPLLDMERLIRNMMGWAGVDEARLREEGEIVTGFGETLSWDYFRYAVEYPVDRWPSQTSILYGELDDITDRATLDAFAARFGCDVTVEPGGEHYFHTPEQLDALRSWTMARVIP